MEGRALGKGREKETEGGSLLEVIMQDPQPQEQGVFCSNGGKNLKDCPPGSGRHDAAERAAGMLNRSSSQSATIENPVPTHGGPHFSSQSRTLQISALVHFVVNFPPRKKHLAAYMYGPTQCGRDPWA